MFGKQCAAEWVHQKYKKRKCGKSMCWYLSLYIQLRVRFSLRLLCYAKYMYPWSWWGATTSRVPHNIRRPLAIILCFSGRTTNVVDILAKYRTVECGEVEQFGEKYLIWIYARYAYSVGFLALRSFVAHKKPFYCEAPTDHTIPRAGKCQWQKLCF